MNSFHSFTLAAFVVTAMYSSTDADDWQLANQESTARISQYETARNSGDPAAIREATLRLQQDPLAIRVINRTASDAFKTQLNQDVRTIQQKTLRVTEQRLTEMGIRPDKVDFFEATNPPKPGDPVKVGQDWDLTIRVNGRDLPTNVSQRIAHDSYYEASTGKRPPPVSDVAARAEYTRAADHHAQRQSLAVTDYQHPEAYGGGSKEGGQIISGPKDARLRDPVQLSKVMDFKSAEARNLAAELRAEGKLGAAVGHDMEQLRQSTKQFDKQVKPRLEELVRSRHETLGREAPKSVIPEYIEHGQSIMKRVEAGEITAAEAHARISKMEPVDSFIRKSADLIEAAEVLQPPGERAEPAQDVFVENVKNRLQTRRIAKVLQRVDAGELTVPQAREQITQLENINLESIRKPEGNLTGRRPLTKGKSSVAPLESSPLSTGRKTALNALGALWIASTAGEAASHEGRRSMEAGEAPDRGRAAANAMWEATLLPGIARGFERGQQIGREELAQAEEVERSPEFKGAAAGMGATGPRAEALFNGLGRVVGDVTAWNLGSTIAQEEIEAEDRRAALEGREPDYSMSTFNGAIRGIGEVLMINTIARAANSVTEEEVMLVGQQQVIRAWAQAKLNEGRSELNGIQLDLEEATAEGNGTSDPEYDALADRYDKARNAMNRLLDSMRQQLGEDNALVQSIAEHVAKLPDPPDATLPDAEGEVAMTRPRSIIPTKEDTTEPDKPHAEDLPSASEFDGKYAIYLSAAGAGRRTPAQPFESMTWSSDGDDRAAVTFVLSSIIPEKALQIVGLRRTISATAIRQVDPSGRCYFSAGGPALRQTMKGIAQFAALAGMGAGSVFGGDSTKGPNSSVKTAAVTITPAGAETLQIIVHSDVIIQAAGTTKRFKKDQQGVAQRLNPPSPGRTPSRR